MFSLSQKLRVGFELNGLCERHAFVRHYVSLMLKVAPRRYKRLFKLGNAAGIIFSLLALCAIVRKA